MEIEFKLFGIPIHVSLFFLISAVVLGRMGTADSPVELAAWIVVMFVGVLVHELGHALTARAFGQQPAIALHGMGGVTVWQPRGGIGPGRRAIITLAGPLVGIAIGLPAAIIGRLATAEGTLAREVFDYVMWVNLVWAIFNLLPMLPLDGGRIMASLLEIVFGRSSLRAAYIGSIVVAVLIGLLMLLGRAYLGLLFCAYFVHLNVAALQEMSRQAPPPPPASAE
jgi:membrane-associated protease RseP (regulator of RpoE activity)